MYLWSGAWGSGLNRQEGGRSIQQASLLCTKAEYHSEQGKIPWCEQEVTGRPGVGFLSAYFADEFELVNNSKNPYENCQE